MTESQLQSWNYFQNHYFEFPTAGLFLDLSKMDLPPDYLSRLEPELQRAFREMAELEAGSIANPDENRMVGHYWLRTPSLSPTAEIREAIESNLVRIEEFAANVHEGKIQGKHGHFCDLLLIGIGGSALGPQFVASALGNPSTDKMRIHFFDNTDPDGMHRTLSGIQDLGRTLTLVVSKSGGTKETQNGMLEAKAAYERAGLNFSEHVVAVTQEGSVLDKTACKEKWICRFPMWDWVGGRTSQTSAVGLLPAALQGFEVRDLLLGASRCDVVTRRWDPKANPAALLAASWYHACNGRGDRNMVVIPYRDRLELLAKYLQQLIMESIGKKHDKLGGIVNQGITVLGNKGATDQHSYIQQLRDGLDDFFVIFVRVLQTCNTPQIELEPSVNSGDYLNVFYLGTRSALTTGRRRSISIFIDSMNAKSVGCIIALFERTVGFYASFCNLNAYNQPGVEAGKIAAKKMISVQIDLLGLLRRYPGQSVLFTELYDQLKPDCNPDDLFLICEHLANNKTSGISRHHLGGQLAYGAEQDNV